MFRILTEEVTHGEVIEFQTDTSDDTRLSPTQREFNLVIGFLHQIIANVHRSIFIVRLHLRINLFRIKVPHRCQVTG